MVVISRPQRFHVPSGPVKRRVASRKRALDSWAHSGPHSPMLTVTKDLVLPTTITGSYPKPNWYTQNLQTRAFKVAMGDSLFREQYLDAVAGILTEQSMAGLDILTDGDARFDLAVGGKSWIFYPLERLGGVEGRRDLSPGWAGDFAIGPGHILWEVQEAYQPPVVTSAVTRGPLEYAAVWKTAQRMTDKPVKFGTSSAQILVRMLWNEHYRSDHELIMDLAAVMNEELRDLAASCPLIQIEEPRHHYAALRADTPDSELQFFSDAFNREVKGVEAEIWVHTCWGNPSQQRLFREVPSYERALPYLLDLDADVVTVECASSNGRDLALLGKQRTKKKIAIGVVSHTNTVVEPPDAVADLIRRALEHIPPERLIISTDCGFGREGLSRRIAFYKCVALVQGTNIVRRELGLPEARVRIADPRYAFAAGPGSREGREIWRELWEVVRFDPSQTKDDLLQALERAAEAAWGAEALPDLRASLTVTAQAIWLINQEPFAPGDLEP